MSSNALSVGVIGAGAWGTTLACVAARNGHGVRLWSRDSGRAACLNQTRIHPRLPGVTLSPGVLATARREDLGGSDLILLATPAQVLRQNLQSFSGVLQQPLPMVICAKGIETSTGRFMSEIVQEIMPAAEPFVLSGPGFAADVMKNKPTAVTLAGRELQRAAALATQLSLPTFRIYSSADLLGVQLGGAVKNVLAIACGISDGRSLGDSTRAALITRAFSEMLRFGKSLGADPLTLTGLSGLGDLVLTCSSLQSRNFCFGMRLARGEVTAANIAEGSTIEGIHTAKAVTTIAAERGLDLPICRAVTMILAGNMTIDEAIDQLLSRPLRSELVQI
jgi:glycerol-3-phosphate dehydrogenase (NAD(P)+)